jgi:outer membrane protein OmpA-like peptidoglycan-associated protein
MKFQIDDPIMPAKNFKNLLSLWLVSTPTQSQTRQHKPWNTWSRLAILASWAAFMSWPTVHAQVSVETKQAGVNARIEVLGEIYALPQAVNASQSRLVVYRTTESQRLEGATSLFINGQYHASLVPDGYHFLCLNPGAVELGTRQYRVGGSARDKYDTVTATRLDRGQTQFLKVMEDNGRPVMQPVSSEQAARELRNARLQMHTVSRVTQARPCQAETAAPITQLAVAPAKDEYVLMVDVLFAFARSDLAGLTQQGHHSIDEMLARIRAKYASIDRVHLIGHTDPLGSAAFNEQLAIQRANTVRQYIEGALGKSAQYSSEGRGARELVLNHCQRKPTPQAIACNQPNRRVVTQVTGQYR